MPKKVPRRGKESPRALRGRTERILNILEKVHPEATCALHHQDPFQLSVATILSAQCTDERVNQVTPALFARFPDASSLASAETAELEALIRPTGFFRAKAKSLVKFSRALLVRFDGTVPHEMNDLVTLPGFGRKTANVVQSHSFGVAEGIAVDTHVLRVSNRLGIAKGDDPIKVEAQLMERVPKNRWIHCTDLLIFHGRKICAARTPHCAVCPVFSLCRWSDRVAYATLK